MVKTYNANRGETQHYAERYLAAKSANALLQLAIERGFNIERQGAESYANDDWYSETMAEIVRLQSRYSLHFTGSRFTVESVSFAQYVEKSIWRKVDFEKGTK